MNEMKSKNTVIVPLELEGMGSFPPPIFTDPFGSYTGLVSDLDDKPVQDADDL